jgi:hypothetical protein
LLNAVRGGPQYWAGVARRISPRGYWHSVYGPSFPCPRIYRWENLPAVLRSIDVEAASEEIQHWWTDYKRSLRERMGRLLHEHVGWKTTLPTDARAMNAPS